MKRTRAMNRTGIVPLLAAFGLLSSLSACEGFRDELGLVKQSPDEFRVVARAPLSIPPEFQLRPPRPGAARPQEGTVQQQARVAVFRAAGAQDAARERSSFGDDRTPGEQSILKAAGADAADPNIRELVDRETRSINEETEYFIDTLVFWKDKETKGVQVDPEAEARRLRENAALGRDATSGETPTIKRKEKGLF